jgi:membrane-bound serine protease (ClpP class)
MGAQGEVLATLRPSGVARLDGRRVDVVSRGEMIEAGARVRVIELLGNRVVVAEADDDATEET